MKHQNHNNLLNMFRKVTGRTTIRPFREPNLHELRGFEPARARKYRFMPGELE